MKFFLLVSTFFCFINFCPTNGEYLFENEKCGKTNFRSTIANGNEVERGQMPWMVRNTITRSDGLTRLCSGAIVAKDLILTAAHCVEDATSVQVSAGRVVYSPSRFDGPMERIITTTDIHQHPGYNHSARDFRHDIAVLKLPTPFEFNRSVKPLCILEENCSRADECKVGHVGGWKVTGNENGTIEKLIGISLNKVDQGQCKSKFNEFSIEIFPAQMCFIGDVENNDACHGEPGGPLLCQRGYRTIAIGISSFNAQCGVHFPAVFLRICIYRPWLKTIISSNTITSRTTRRRTTLPPSSSSSSSSSPLPLSTITNTTFLVPGSTTGTTLTNKSPNPTADSSSSPPPSSTTTVLMPSSATGTASLNSRKKFCPENSLPNVEHGHFVKGSNDVGTIRTFKCDVDYILDGRNTSVCQINGKWSEPCGFCIHKSKYNYFYYFSSDPIVSFSANLSPNNICFISIFYFIKFIISSNYNNKQ